MGTPHAMHSSRPALIGPRSPRAAPAAAAARARRRPATSGGSPAAPPARPARPAAPSPGAASHRRGSPPGPRSRRASPRSTAAGPSSSRARPSLRPSFHPLLLSDSSRESQSHSSSCSRYSTIFRSRRFRTRSSQPGPSVTTAIGQLVLCLSSRSGTRRVSASMLKLCTRTESSCDSAAISIVVSAILVRLLRGIPAVVADLLSLPEELVRRLLRDLQEGAHPVDEVELLVVRLLERGLHRLLSAGHVPHHLPYRCFHIHHASLVPPHQAASMSIRLAHLFPLFPCCAFARSSGFVECLTAS